LPRRDSENERGSERTCVVSGVKGPPEAMLRFVLDREGRVTPDIRRKLPGRGVWTCLSAAVVRRAAAKGSFARGFRMKAEATPELANAVDALLESDALQFLSLANKAGLVAVGAFKVEAAMAKGGIAALIQASDGAADGAAKMQQALRRRLGEEASGVARVDLFASSQLDLALGKANVIHAALRAGAATTAFLERAGRLLRYRESEAASAITARDRGGGSETPAGKTQDAADRPGDWKDE
jgi:uncharacterized protein